MTQEEKAKRYDEAIEKARTWKDKSGMPKDKQGILDDIFPELKESEDKDERIRKALLEIVHDTTGDELWVDYNVHKEEALVWLEKQGQVHCTGVGNQQHGVRCGDNGIFRGVPPTHVLSPLWQGGGYKAGVEMRLAA